MTSMHIPAHEPDGHTCAAIVINREWLMTAAHCFNKFWDKTKWRIYFGRYHKLIHDKTEIVRYIDSIYIHPNFKGNMSLPSNATWFDRKANDIALLKLNARLPQNNSFIGALCLPPPYAEPTINETCYVTGWGDTYGTGFDLVLKQAKVPIIDVNVCREWMIGYNVGDSMICAGYERGGQDSCQVRIMGHHYSISYMNLTGRLGRTTRNAQ